MRAAARRRLPVAVDKAGVDVVRALHASDGLQADPGGLVGHDVDKAILELVAREVGADEPGGVGFGVGESLQAQAESQRFVQLFLLMLEPYANPPNLPPTFHLDLLPGVPSCLSWGGTGSEIFP